MSRFYGSVDGSANTQATRRGFKGIRTHARGWDLGVKVDGREGFGADAERDTFDVRVTGGSHDYRTGFDLAEISDAGEGWIRVSVSLIDNACSVFYVAPDGTRHSRKVA